MLKTRSTLVGLAFILIVGSIILVRSTQGGQLLEDQPYRRYLGQNFSLEYPSGWLQYSDSDNYVRFVKSTEPYVGIEVVPEQLGKDTVLDDRTPVEVVKSLPDGSYKTVLVSIGSKTYGISLVVGGGIGGGQDVAPAELQKLEIEFERVVRSMNSRER